MEFSVVSPCCRPRELHHRRLPLHRCRVYRGEFRLTIVGFFFLCMHACFEWRNFLVDGCSGCSVQARKGRRVSLPSECVLVVGGEFLVLGCWVLFFFPYIHEFGVDM